MTDPEIKLIRHASSRIRRDDDPTMPYRVEVDLCPPEFMVVTFVMLYGGSDEIVVRCATREAVDRFLDKLELRTHPRMRRIRIVGPDGAIEEIGR